MYDRTSQGALDVAAPADFGLRVTSVEAGATGRINRALPLVVERPMYVNAVIAASPPGYTSREPPTAIT